MFDLFYSERQYDPMFMSCEEILFSWAFLCCKLRVVASALGLRRSMLEIASDLGLTHTSRTHPLTAQ